MATVLLETSPTTYRTKPNIYVRVDNNTTRNGVAQYFANAIVRNVRLGLNEDFGTATIDLPSVRFGHHINFGSRVQIYVDTKSNRIFDGRVVIENSTLDGSRDGVSVTAYGPKWLLNTQTVVGTYDAKWGTLAGIETNVWTEAKKIIGLQTAGNPLSSEDIAIIGKYYERYRQYHNLYQKTIFNEGKEDFKHGEKDMGDQAFKVFQITDDGIVRYVPLFDKKSPHVNKPKVEDANGNLITNKYYPQKWTYGDILAYLIFFYRGNYDLRILKQDIDLMNSLPPPSNLDLNCMPLISAINKVISTAGPRWAFDIESIGEGSNLYYRFYIIDTENAIDRDVEIALSSFIQGQTRLNLSSASVTRDASNVITSLRGLGRPIELEMTVQLVPAWANSEVTELFPGVTPVEIQKIFYLRHLQGNDFSMQELDQSSNIIGTSTLTSNGASYYEVYHRCRDFFDNRIYKVWRLPEDSDVFKATLGTDFKYEKTHQVKVGSQTTTETSISCTLDDFFSSDRKNTFRKIRPPETPLHNTDVVGDVPDSEPTRYEKPLIFAWDESSGLFDAIPFAMDYAYGTGTTEVPEDEFGDGDVDDTGMAGVASTKSEVSFTVSKNTIVFSQFMTQMKSKKYDVKQARYDSALRDIIRDKPNETEFISFNNLGAATIFMTACIETDVRMSPLVTANDVMTLSRLTDKGIRTLPYEMRKFKDFEDAGILINRYVTDDNFRVVIRDHSVLFHLFEYKNVGGEYVASSESKNTAEVPKGESILSGQYLRLRTIQNNKGRFYAFTDDKTGNTVTKAFIDDWDDFVDTLQSKLSTKSRYKESMTFVLDKFDISYSVGQRIRNIRNSKAYGTGFYNSNVIITNIEHACEGEFRTTITATDMQQDR